MCQAQQSMLSQPGDECSVTTAGGFINSVKSRHMGQPGEDGAPCPGSPPLVVDIVPWLDGGRAAAADKRVNEARARDLPPVQRLSAS